MAKNIKQLAEKLRKDLREDILFRYDNSEYFDYDIIEIFEQDNDLSDIEKNEIEKILGI